MDYLIDKRRKEIDKYIALFENGEERFMNSALVNTVIQGLVEGKDPIKIIDQLCEQCESIQKSFSKYALSDARPIMHVLTPEEYEKCGFKNP